MVACNVWRVGRKRLARDGRGSAHPDEPIRSDPSASVEGAHGDRPMDECDRHAEHPSWLQAAWLVCQLLACAVVLGLVVGFIVTWGGTVVVQVNR